MSATAQIVVPRPYTSTTDYASCQSLWCTWLFPSWTSARSTYLLARQLDQYESIVFNGRSCSPSTKQMLEYTTSSSYANGKICMEPIRVVVFRLSLSSTTQCAQAYRDTVPPSESYFIAPSVGIWQASCCPRHATSVGNDSCPRHLTVRTAFWHMELSISTAERQPLSRICLLCFSLSCI